MSIKNFQMNDKNVINFELAQSITRQSQCQYHRYSRHGPHRFIVLYNIQGMN